MDEQTLRDIESDIAVVRKRLAALDAEEKVKPWLAHERQAQRHEYENMLIDLEERRAFIKRVMV